MEPMQRARPFRGAHRTEGPLRESVIQDGSDATDGKAENEALDVESCALG